jgi:hypothetical protein
VFKQIWFDLTDIKLKWDRSSIVYYLFLYFFQITMLSLLYNPNRISDN